MPTKYLCKLDTFFCIFWRALTCLKDSLSFSFMAPGLSSGYFDNKKNYVSIYVKAVVPFESFKYV